MDQLTEPATAPASATKPAWSIWLPRVGILLLILLGGFFAGRAGLQLRHWTWDTTVPIRMSDEIDRGYRWGRAAAAEGYLNQYEKMQQQQPTDDNWLDYAPLRLAILTRWGQWSQAHFPTIENWRDQPSYAVTQPVLRFNLFLEIIGLIAAFFLTRHWAIRNASSPSKNSLRYFFRGWAPGIAAALLLWFNPAIIVNGYGWPAWDYWIVPPFLLAAMLASFDWWFAAGISVGIGAMLGGQELLAIPIFIAWSLILLRPMFTLRFLGGGLTAIAIITSGWMLSYIPAAQLAHARDVQSTFAQAHQMPIDTFKIPRTLDVSALIWVIGVLSASAGLPWVAWLTLKTPQADQAPRWRKTLESPWAWRFIAAVSAFILVMWPWMLKRNHPDWWVGASAASLLACAVLLIRPRGIAYLTAGATGTALLLCMSIFHGSSSWCDCGWRFETQHHPAVYVGMTDNLPAILTNDFNYQPPNRPNFSSDVPQNANGIEKTWPMEELDNTAFTVEKSLIWHYPEAAIEITTGQFLSGLFWITFCLCCLGAAMHARRRDARLLIAITAPWLMYFCFPPQIQERYLLFAAAISCVCAGVSVGMTLLGVFLSLTTVVMMLDVMLSKTDYGNRIELGKLLTKQFPSLFTRDAGEKLLTLVNGTHPDLGYAVILCGLVFLYYSIAPRWRQSPGL